MASKRQYHSPLREQAARGTRAAIVEAARALFHDEGYAAVTMKAVAARAGVAPQTLYAAFGSKADLVLAIDVRLDTTPGPGEIGARLAAAQTPVELLAAGATLQRRLYERNYDYIETLRRAALADHRLAGPWTAGQERHRQALRRVVERLASWDALLPGLTEDEATDIAAALNGVDLYRQFVVDSGWTADRYETWLAGAMQALLLEPRWSAELESGDA
ncbi:MAG TPA: helix-turn-helix domain-containing protein [Nocardioidaceae bacterium]|nr:helix-turn-helix domain-containing protein [Nocardioidaceae bacterium]